MATSALPSLRVNNTTVLSSVDQQRRLLGRLRAEIPFLNFGLVGLLLVGLLVRTVISGIVRDESDVDECKGLIRTVCQREIGLEPPQIISRRQR
jgi:hypothetical protein